MSYASGIEIDAVKTLDFNEFYLTMWSIFSIEVTTIDFFSKTPGTNISFTDW